MKKILFLIVLVLTSAFLFIPSASAEPNLAPNAPVAGTLVFNDEFDGNSLDTSRWLTCYWWATNHCTSQPFNELQLYSPSNVQVGNGMLTLRATSLKEPISYCDKNCRNYAYTSGMVQAGGGRWPDRAAGFTFTYGYIEARMKIPAGKGMFPGFWLWPANYQDPPEIDIMEALGNDPNTIYMTYHLPDGTQSQRELTGADFSQGYHVFGLDWTPTALVWYVDGVESYRWVGTTPNQPMYPIMNLAVGGNWPGSPNAATMLPADLSVDYIRVFAH